MPEPTDKIRNRFRKLGLSVTDDLAKINAKYQALQPHYYKLTGSTDEEERVEGRLWFDLVTPLSNEKRLQEFIHSCQEEFYIIARGMGADKAFLVKMAQDQFMFDPDLAQSLVEDLLKTEVRALPVTQPQAESRPGQVRLSWRRSSRQHCERISVERLETGQTGSPVKKDLGLVDDYLDQDVEAGKSYTYKIFSYLGGLSCANPPVLEITVAQEPQNLKATWQVDADRPLVRLEWQPPAQSKEVLLFWREGNPPAITALLQPKDKATHGPVQVSGRQYWEKEAITGKNYHFLIVAQFAGHSRSDGVRSSVLIPGRPSAATDVTASYNRKENLLDLRWKPPAEKEPVEYLVVRYEGELPPKDYVPGEGVLLTENLTVDLSLKDKKPTPGKIYWYAVYTQRHGLTSHIPALPPQAVITAAEVYDVEVDPGDRQVVLSWKTPENAFDVQVLRTSSTRYPQGPEDPNAIRLANVIQDGVRDQNLTNRTTYNYLISCRYRLPNGRTVYSEGLLYTKISPKAAPEPIMNLVIREQPGPRDESGKIICTHEHLPEGEVKIFRLPKKPGVKCGDVITVEQIKEQEYLKWDVCLTPKKECEHIDYKPKPHSRYYLPISILGTNATVGQIRRLSTPPVKDLIGLAAEDGVSLSWKWPDPCEMVLLVRRLGEPPVGAQDLEAQHWSVDRQSFEAGSESFLDRIHPSETTAHYCAYGQLEGHNTGEQDKCCCQVSLAPRKTLEFKLYQEGGNVQVSWKIAQGIKDFAGFVIRGGPDQSPLNRDEGTEILRVTGDYAAKGADEWQSRTMTLPKNYGHRPLKYRLFLLKPEDRQHIKVIHPPGTGYLQLRREPHMVVCPHCLETFPSRDILFGYKNPPAGVEPGQLFPYPATFFKPQGFLPENFPKGKQGRFDEKYCPKCRKILPDTAGNQQSLTLGIFGGPSVGKTAFITTLVQRLKTLGLAPISLDDDTNKRFDILYQRLYIDKNPPYPTQETDPPLIYSVTPGQRTCSLALYDTAGEFFRSADDIVEKTPYLKEADGLILLIDPLQCECLANRLKGRRAAIPALEIMNYVIRIFRNKLNLLPAHKIPTPLAVAFTKADCLYDADLIDRRSPWHLPLFHPGKKFDLQLHNELDCASGQVVKQFGDTVFDLVKNHFTDYAFFCISSTGCNLDPISNKFPFIVPRRVEDPLLWLFSRLGVIEAE